MLTSGMIMCTAAVAAVAQGIKYQSARKCIALARQPRESPGCAWFGNERIQTNWRLVQVDCFIKLTESFTDTEMGDRAR